MSALVGLYQPIIFMEWMGLDLFWNPISDTISLIKDENSRGKNVYIIPTEGLSQKNSDIKKLQISLWLIGSS